MEKNILQGLAFSPAGITSFFRIHGSAQNPSGATGGGLTITRGVKTHVIAETAKKTQIKIFINGIVRDDAKTSRCVVDKLIHRSTSTSLKITVNHFVEPPIGAGFGTSAAAALSLTLALSQALRLNLTTEEGSVIAHESEVENQTGLGTIAALMIGGCVVTYKPGPPGVCKILRLPIDPDLKVVAAYYNSTLTSEILQLPNLKKRIDNWGDKILQKILENPQVDTLLQASKEFAIQTGFASEKIMKTIKVMEYSGALAAAQNMLGEAVHAVAYDEEIPSIVSNLRKKVKPTRILISEIGGSPRTYIPLTQIPISK
jgi:pantoate kinase